MKLERALRLSANLVLHISGKRVAWDLGMRVPVRASGIAAVALPVPIFIQDHTIMGIELEVTVQEKLLLEPPGIVQMATPCELSCGESNWRRLRVMWEAVPLQLRHRTRRSVSWVASRPITLSSTSLNRIWAIWGVSRARRTNTDPYGYPTMDLRTFQTVANPDVARTQYVSPKSAAIWRIRGELHGRVRGGICSGER